MEGYEVRMLGSFTFLVNGMPVAHVPTGKLQLLLAYLWLHAGSPVNRKQTAFLFWPDTTEQQALTNLRKLIFRLKKIFPSLEQHLVQHNGCIEWQSEIPVYIDAVLFEELADSDSITELAEAVSHYRGPFLPGADMEWVERYREELTCKYLKTLEKVMMNYERERDYDKALDYAYKLYFSDKFNEGCHVNIIRLLALKGDSAGAKNRLEELKMMLRDELDAEPAPDTVSYCLDLIRRKADQTPVLQKQSVPFTGRKREWAVLHSWWETCSENGSMLGLIEGEAGVGKTRLAEEFTLWAASRRIRVIKTRCFSSGGAFPYEPFLGSIEQLTGSSLLPEALPDSSDTISSVDSNMPVKLSLRNWYRDVDTTLFSGEPSVLLIDNMQWADRETLHMLEYFIYKNREQPLLVIGTYRTGDDDKAAVAGRFMEGLRKRGKLLPLKLSRLSEYEAYELAARLIQVPGSQLEMICKYGDGNPLLISEIARSMETDVSSGHFKTSVTAIMAGRIGKLPPRLRTLCQAAAVLGKPVSLSFLKLLIKESSGMSDHVNELLERHVFKKTESGHYDFYHDVMREAVLLTMSDAEISEHHGNAGSVMATMESESCNASEIAYHYEQAGLTLAAKPFFHKAAEEAEMVYAHRNTLYFCKKLLTLTEGKEYLDILARMINACIMAGDWSEAENGCREWLIKSGPYISVERKASMEVQLAVCLRLQGKYQEALLHLNNARHVFNTLGNKEGLGEVLGNEGIVLHYLGENKRALASLEKCILIGAGTTLEGKYSGISGNVYYEQEQYGQAMSLFNRTAAIADRHHVQPAVAKAFTGKALTFIDLEEVDQAFLAINERIRISRALKERMGIAAAVGIKGKIYARAGYYDEAVKCLVFSVKETALVKDRRTAAIALGVLGNACTEKGELKTASWMLKEAARLSGELHIPYFHCDHLYYLGRTYADRGKWDESRFYLRDAEKLAVRHSRTGQAAAIALLILCCDVNSKELSREEAAVQLRSLLERNPAKRTELAVLFHLWSLCGDIESITKARTLLTALFRKNPVPVYKQLADKFGITLEGKALPPPELPAEAEDAETVFTSIKELCTRL